MFLSQSGADFLEASNAKRIHKNRQKLEEIKQALEDPQCLYRYEKIDNLRRLKDAILRAEIWLEKQAKKYAEK
jgi:hypothetical protein